MTLDDKQKLFEKVVQVLEANLQILVDSAFEAKEASTNEESKAENKYDTRGLEASYLASGQARRAQKLQEQIYLLKKVNLRTFKKNEPIGVSALVELLVDDEKSLFLFLLPAAGAEIPYKNGNLKTISVESPLGQNLLGYKVGHDFSINGRDYEIHEVF